MWQPGFFRLLVCRGSAAFLTSGPSRMKWNLKRVVKYLQRSELSFTLYPREISKRMKDLTGHSGLRNLAKPAYHFDPIDAPSCFDDDGCMDEECLTAKCVLIVDDNALIRRGLRQTFESVEGWHVCGEAGDGREGIEKAKELRPDLIILDLSMPTLNGLEAARVLSKTMPKVPLLMYSAHMDSFVEKEAMAAGVSAVLSKAADVNSLVSKAHALLLSD